MLCMLAPVSLFAQWVVSGTVFDSENEPVIGATVIEKGHAYATDRGDVYFSVESFPGYGKLSGRKLEDAYESVRIENEENKRNPLDFALWKFI